MLITAVRVAAHDHALIQTAEITQRLFLVLGFQRLCEVEALHLNENIDAPAVRQPVGEVGVIMRRAGPDDRAVLHLAGPRLFLALVGLEHDLVDLFEGVYNARIDAAVHLIVPLAEQLVARANDLRIRRLVDRPLFELVARLGVEALHGGEVSVPTPLRAGLLLNELDAGLDILGGALYGLFVLVADGEAQMEHREIREAAGHIGGRHGRAVARHGAGDEALAHVRQRIQHQSAAFGGRHRAAVRRQAEALDRVDVRHAGELVDLGDQEHREELIRNADQVGEAGHELSHRHLVEEDDLSVQLGAVAVLRIALRLKDKVLGNVTENVKDHEMAHLESRSALAHGVFVHKADAAEIGHHPAVVQHGVKRRNEILGECAKQHAPHAQPLIEVIRRVSDAAPLAADGTHGAFLVEAAELLFAFKQELAALGAGHGGDLGGFLRNTLGKIDPSLLLACAESFPVGSKEHILGDIKDFLQVFALRLPVHVVLRAEERRIGVFRSFRHQFSPPSLRMRLISSDSTNACTRVRSCPELPLLYRRSIDKTGQFFSSAMMWLTSARSNPQ